jgi:F-box-like/Ras family/Galactose oxidase, central domain
MLVHGGRTRDGIPGDAWVYSFSGAAWEEIQTVTPAGPKGDPRAPSPRYFFSLTHWGDALLVFGGLGRAPEDAHSDSWKPKNLGDAFVYGPPDVLDDVQSGELVSDGNSGDSDDVDTGAGPSTKTHRRPQKSQFAIGSAESHDPLSSLPDGALAELAEFLDPESLCRLSLVNRRLRFFFSSDAIWKVVVARALLNFREGDRIMAQAERDFGDDLSSGPSVTGATFFWKSVYGNKCAPRHVKPVEFSKSEKEIAKSFFGDSPPELRMTVLGPGGVGKTACTIMYVSKNFVDEYDPTIGKDCVCTSRNFVLC